jgi:hypothetical protein
MIIFLSIASVLGIKTKIKKNKNIRRIEKPSFYRGLSDCRQKVLA